MNVTGCQQKAIELLTGCVWVCLCVCMGVFAIFPAATVWL